MRQVCGFFLARAGAFEVRVSGSLRALLLACFRSFRVEGARGAKAEKLADAAGMPVFS